MTKNRNRKKVTWTPTTGPSPYLKLNPAHSPHPHRVGDATQGWDPVADACFRLLLPLTRNCTPALVGLACLLSPPPDREGGEPRLHPVVRIAELVCKNIQHFKEGRLRDEPTVQAARSLLHTGSSAPCAGVPLGVPLTLVVFHTAHYTQRPAVEWHSFPASPRPSAAPACVILCDVLLAPKCVLSFIVLSRTNV
jgi:hypothetical protein